MSAEIIKFPQFKPRQRLPIRVNLLSGRGGILEMRDILVRSEDYADCRRIIRGLGAENNRLDLGLLRAFAGRAGEAEKKLWGEIVKCDRLAADKAAKLAKKRWLVLASYLSVRTIIEKMESGNNSAELFDEFSRGSDELYKCEYLLDFIGKYAVELSTGRYNGKIFVPKVIFLSEGRLLHGISRAIEEREDALRALIKYLEAYSSAERYRATRQDVSSRQMFVCEISTWADVRWGRFKLFTDLVLDYFGPPAADAGKETPPKCKILEWADSLARFKTQPLFFKKLPDGSKQFAVVRPHFGGSWGHTHNWTNEIVPYYYPGGRYVGERAKPAQTIAFYYIPTNPEQIKPVSTGLGGICRDLFGVPAEAIKTLDSVLNDKK